MSPKVLVVDDEADVIMLCKVNLEYEGYEVIEAKTGPEALDKVKDEKPDLVLLDVMMAGMDGWQVLKRLKEDAHTKNIPVVMLTAKVTERDQITGLSSGATDYITKPFSPTVLSKAVKEALEPRSPEEEEARRQEVVEKLRFIESNGDE